MMTFCVCIHLWIWVTVYPSFSHGLVWPEKTVHHDDADYTDNHDIVRYNAKWVSYDKQRPIIILQTNWIDIYLWGIISSSIYLQQHTQTSSHTYPGGIHKKVIPLWYGGKRKTDCIKRAYWFGFVIIIIPNTRSSFIFVWVFFTEIYCWKTIILF